MFIRQRTQSARLLRCSRMAVALALPSALHCQLTSSRCGAACRARDTALASERRARRSPQATHAPPVPAAKRDARAARPAPGGTNLFYQCCGGILGALRSALGGA